MCPIKGVSERPRLPRLGKIHLGIKLEPEGRASYPRPTDYFVAPVEVQAVFGEKPKDLRIAFPTEDAEQWASHWYRAYSSSRGLTCKGDGETAVRLVDLDKAVDKETGALPDSKLPAAWPLASRETKRTGYQEIECPGEACPQYQAKQCRQVMNLQFLLPEVPGLGIWQLDTSSWNSIKNILSGISLIKALVGRLSAIPLTLSLVPLEVTPAGTPKKTVHVLRLTAPYKLADLYRYAALPPGQALTLPAPDLEAPEDLFPEEEPQLSSDSQPQPSPTVVEAKEVVREQPGLAGKAKLKPPRDPNTITTLNGWQKACFEDFGLQPSEAAQKAGYGRPQDIATVEGLRQAYQQIAAMYSPQG